MLEHLLGRANKSKQRKHEGYSTSLEVNSFLSVDWGKESEREFSIVSSRKNTKKG